MAAVRQWPTMRCLRDAQRLRWLHMTVGNLAISAFRRNQAFGDRLPGLEAVFRPRPADTHAEAVSGIALERCWRAIGALPPQQHAVAVMRWLFAMTRSLFRRGQTFAWPGWLLSFSAPQRCQPSTAIPR